MLARTSQEKKEGESAGRLEYGAGHAARAFETDTRMMGEALMQVLRDVVRGRKKGVFERVFFEREKKIQMRHPCVDC